MGARGTPVMEKDHTGRETDKQGRKGAEVHCQRYENEEFRPKMLLFLILEEPKPGHCWPLESGAVQISLPGSALEDPEQIVPCLLQKERLKARSEMSLWN